ncbi:MAG: hypothetical protein JWO67_1823 [Streptosporangiaceae bacterium]|nr:hypothetical protein [Streptosporangiaceae bacterium]
MDAPVDEVAALAVLKAVYADKWHIWNGRGKWHAHRIGNFRAVEGGKEPVHSLHAPTLPVLAVLLIVEEAKNLVSADELADLVRTANGVGEWDWPGA